jgi:hypothetical protein
MMFGINNMKTKKIKCVEGHGSKVSCWKCPPPIKVIGWIQTWVMENGLNNSAAVIYSSKPKDDVKWTKVEISLPRKDK